MSGHRCIDDALRDLERIHKFWEEQRAEARKTLKGKIKWLFRHPPEPRFSDLYPQDFFITEENKI